MNLFEKFIKTVNNLHTIKFDFTKPVSKQKKNTKQKFNFNLNMSLSTLCKKF